MERLCAVMLAVIVRVAGAHCGMASTGVSRCGCSVAWPSSAGPLPLTAVTALWRRLD